MTPDDDAAWLLEIAMMISNFERAPQWPDPDRLERIAARLTAGPQDMREIARVAIRAARTAEPLPGYPLEEGHEAAFRYGCDCASAAVGAALADAATEEEVTPAMIEAGRERAVAYCVRIEDFQMHAIYRAMRQAAMSPDVTE